MCAASSTNSAPEQATYQQTFKEVAVVLIDGNQTLMQRCIKCRFVCRNLSFSKISHWRNCPSTCAFTYLYCCDGASNDRIEAMCLLCHSRYNDPSIHVMKRHHNQCVKGKPPIDVDSLIASTNADATSNEIEYVSEYGVTKREMDGQRRLAHNIYPPGYKIKLVQTSKGLRRHSECLLCNEQRKTPAQTYFELHRRKCPLPGDVLFSVSTQPFDTTISSSIDGDYYSASTSRTCFICNTAASESFVNMYETVSLHSNTPVYDFVWKFLDDKPSVRDDSIDAANANWSSLCNKCLNKINEYDLALMAAAKIEEELRWELSQTEQLFAGQDGNDITIEDDEQPNVGQDDQHQTVEDEMLPVLIFNRIAEDETINLDSPPPSEDNEVDTISDNAQNDETQYTIELSDDEDEAETQAIELLSDDEC